MRVLQLCADRGIAPGSTKGAAQHLRGIADGLVALGHDLECFTERPAVGSFPVEVSPIHDLAIRLRADPAFDLIYERYSLGHDVGLQLAKAHDVPFILEVNAPLVDEAALHRPDSVLPHHRAVEQRLLVEADLVVTVSTDLQRWVERLRSGPTVTVPNGFEPQWFPAPAVQSEHPVTLGFIGHPKPWHGADRLVEVVAELSHRGLRTNLLVVGGGPGAERIMQLAEQRAVASQVTVTGALPPAEASRLLTTCDIGLAPYREQDPFYFCPLKVIDYLAAGLPIVASALGDIPALVGDAGITVPAEDDVALVETVERMVLDRDLRRRLGIAGRARAFRTLTWHRTTETTLASIRELADQLV